jgi:anti-sigma regulatory factor (Ser/Thr protein kinase)
MQAMGGTAIDSRPLTLAALGTAPEIARTRAVLILREAGLGHLAEDAEIIVSELATNAVQAARKHARGDVPVIITRIACRERTVRMEIRDAAPGTPQMREFSADQVGGRGLTIVNALTGDRWGWYRTEGGGKAVFAELGRYERAGGGERTP